MLKREFLKYGNIKFDEPNFIDELIDGLFLWIFPDRIKPNHLTLFRYLITPFVFYFLIIQNYYFSFFLFLLAIFTDALDGAMARIREEITRWGKLHDPLADKVLISIVGIVLITRYLDFRIITAILGLEVLTIISAINFHEKKEGDEEMGSRLPGKIKMIFQSFGLIFIFLYLIFNMPILVNFAAGLLYLSIFFSLINIFVYRAL